MDAGRLLVGEIGAPHGVRGDVRVKSHTGDPLAIADYGPLVSDDGRVFHVEAIRPDKTVVIVSFKEIRDRNAAEAAKGVKLYVERDALTDDEEDDDSFFHADLIGLKAVDTSGKELGEIIAIHDFGAGDLLDVAVADGPSVLVPFTQQIVPQLDIEAGHVTVDPPAGLFDKPEPRRPKRRRSPKASEKAKKPGAGSA
ncbi:ribosome maturation factor RimM [Tepidamorphus sp. 3E244]|uniref:ribosome maturation factor RimM n=1 Tax=Tepidamorphus sp. 3E244 TaxID=3385498 RepID=UPI0038FC6521